MTEASRGAARMIAAPVVFPLMAPLGLAGLALAGWLLARGFREQERPA
jgi:hypothetical protein